MATPTPTLTLLTTERSWHVNTPNTSRCGLRRNEKGKLFKVVSPNILEQLRECIVIPYAYRDEQDLLICIVGMDENDQAIRIYNLVDLHTPTSLSNNNREEYDASYITTLQARYDSYKQDAIVGANLSYATKTAKITYEEKIATLQVDADKWMANQVVCMNRYFAVTSRPTLLTTEVQWLGDISTNPAHRRPVGIPASYTRRLIVSQEIRNKLPKNILTPFAVVDSNNRIVFIAGTDAEGNDERYYDIDTLHKLSRPDDGLAEEYTLNYVELLCVRAESYLKYKETAKEEEGEKENFSMSIKERDRIALDQIKNRNTRKRNWIVNKLVGYMNRYFGVLKDVIWLIAVKTVVIRHIEGTRYEVPEVTFKLMSPNNFIGAHAIEKLPGDSISIGKLWYGHKNCGQYNGIGVGEGLDETYLKYQHGLRLISPNATSQTIIKFLITEGMESKKQSQEQNRVQISTRSPSVDIPHISTSSRRVPSSGEIMLEQILRNMNIPFERQQSIITVDCAGMKGGGLTFDFYIPAIKLAIEIDGKQHYGPVALYGGIKGFIDTLRRDLLKHQLCKRHIISLLRINYKNMIRAGEAIDEIIRAIRTVFIAELPCIADDFQEERQRLYEHYTSAAQK